jgi:O-antigen/teichoic acid export membrane protein
MEKTNKMLIFMLVAVGINIMGNVIFIPKIGVIATAYTLIASALVYNLLTIIVSRDFWIGKFQL